MASWRESTTSDDDVGVDEGRPVVDPTRLVGLVVAAFELIACTEGRVGMGLRGGMRVAIGLG